MGLEIKRNKEGLYQIKSSISGELISEKDWVTVPEAKYALIVQLFYRFIDEAIRVDMDFPRGFTIDGKREPLTGVTYCDWALDKINGGGNEEIYNKRAEEIISRIITIEPEDVKKLN